MELAPLAALRIVATEEQVGPRAAERLASAYLFLHEQVIEIEARLQELVHQGMAPGTEAAAHLLRSGGKRVRPLVLLLSAACFAPPSSSCFELAVVAELVHMATLLHDDVIDEGQERRGHPTSRRLFGNAVSVLAGDLLLTHALERAGAVAPVSVLMDLFRTLRTLVDGEIVQLRGRVAIDLSEENYLQIVRDKTASLFAWSSRTGGRMSGASLEAEEALYAFGLHLGVAFQLVDDTLDFVGDPQEMGKAVCVDVAEGRLTLPLLLALQQKPELIVDVEGTRSGDQRAAQRLVSQVQALRVCDEVSRRAREATEQAASALEAIPESPARAILSGVANDLAMRLH